MSGEISGFFFDGLTQTYFERGAYLSSFLSFLLRILGAKKNSSKEKTPPATAQSCSVIQSFQASKVFPLQGPCNRRRRKTWQVLSSQWSSPIPSVSSPRWSSAGDNTGRCFLGEVMWALEAAHQARASELWPGIEINQWPQSSSHTWPRKSIPMSHHQAQSLAAGKM